MTLLDHIAYLALLAVVFSAVTITAFAIFRVDQAKNIFRAGDKLVATFFDFDGYHTLSAECGKLAATGGPTWPASIIDFVFGKGHCEKAAQREGLI
jgi:hypothetical protein